MSMLLIEIDQIPTHLLGLYGNTLFQTPALDALAGQSIVLETALRDGDLQAASIGGPGDWLHVHASIAASQAEENQSLPDGGTKSSPPPSDQQAMGPRPNQGDTHRITLPAVNASATEWSNTVLAGYLTQAIERFELQAKENSQQDLSLWIELPVLGHAWDAPLAWREFLAGADDPEIWKHTQPPALFNFSEALDPDTRLLYEQACGAQVMLLDHGVEFLINWWESHPVRRKSPVVLTAGHGFSLGEHRSLGHDSDSAYIEQVQVPFLLRPSGAWPYSVRVPGVQRQSDWLSFATAQAILPSTTSGASDWLQATIDTFAWPEYSLFGHTRPAINEAPPENANAAVRKRHDEHQDTGPSAPVQLALASPPRTAVLSWTQRQIAVRTNHWSFLIDCQGTSRLYVRPDDRFEQNDVSLRCQGLVALFQTHLLSFFAILAADCPVPKWLNGVLANAKAIDADLEDTSETAKRPRDLEHLPIDFWLSAG